MINFLLWASPAMGPSMLIVPIGSLLLIFLAWLFWGNKGGERGTMAAIIILLIWGLFIGCYHIFPVYPSFNNMCPPDQQTAGYCDTGTK